MDKSKFDIGLYQKMPQMILGFHGCDKDVAMDILNSPKAHLKPSNNSYDWLGDGIYFWLNDPQRAYEWACKMHERDPEKVKEPFVIGAVIVQSIFSFFSLFITDINIFTIFSASLSEVDGKILCTIGVISSNGMLSMLLEKA